MPMVESALARAFGRQVRRAAEVDLAVVQGAARWAKGIPHRRCGPIRPRPDIAPLSWAVPDDTATVVRWLVERGDAYGKRVTLARVRLANSSLYDLVTGAPGSVLQVHRQVGNHVISGDWLMTALLPPAPDGLLPRPLRRLVGTEERVAALAFRDNGRQLAVCCESGQLSVVTRDGTELYRRGTRDGCTACRGHPMEDS